jgi:hypothetical protein
MFIKWLIIFTISIPAWGYNLTQDFMNGFYWASLPINIVVIDNNIPRKNMVLSKAQRAVAEWEVKTGLSLWDITESGSSNIIRWSTNFAAETKMDPASVLAVAIRYTTGPYFAKSEIIINGDHSAFNTDYQWINEMNLLTTLVHELGHTMGLDHSENMMAVMAPTLQAQYAGLHPDDINGMSHAIEQTEERQITRYVSPLAYSKEQKSAQPLSCGTTGPVSPGAAGNGILSLAAGMLIAFVRKIFGWFKSGFQMPKRRHGNK